MLKRLRRDGRGSAMVEFALVAPLLVLILLGIMVMGIVINSKIIVAGAAREAGRTWAILEEDSTARAKATEAITSGGLKLANGDHVLFNPKTDVQFEHKGDYVTAIVIYRQPTFVPLMAKLIDSGSSGDGYLTLRSQAIFRVER